MGENLLSGHQSKNTCKGCQKRFPGCHDSCPEYQSFKESLAEERRRESEVRRLDRYGMRLVSKRQRDRKGRK